MERSRDNIKPYKIDAKKIESLMNEHFNKSFHDIKKDLNMVATIQNNNRMAIIYGGYSEDMKMMQYYQVWCFDHNNIESIYCFPGGLVSYNKASDLANIYTYCGSAVDRIEL